MPKYEQYACPFCNIGQITVRVFGGTWQEKRGANSSLGRIKSVRKSAMTIIAENDCKNCGKTAEEIDEKL